jgi:predicted CoA-binding protein
MANMKDVLEQASTIAVVGMSSEMGTPAGHVPAQLKMAGYRIIPINPNRDRILGEKTYARLADVPERVDVVEVFRPAEEAPDIARQAVAIGARALWLQVGLTSPEARDIAERAGLTYIENRCMAVERVRCRVARRRAR